MLFIQTEGAPRSADSTITLLFIQTGDVTGCLPVLFIQTEDVLAEKENKNLKVVERFRVERKFKQGCLCVELEGPPMLPTTLYLKANVVWRGQIIL